MPTCQTVSLLLPLAHHLCSAHEYVTNNWVTRVIKSTMTPTTRRKRSFFFLPPHRYLIYCMLALLCNILYICLTCETFLVQGQEERQSTLGAAKSSVQPDPLGWGWKKSSTSYAVYISQWNVTVFVLVLMELCIHLITPTLAIFTNHAPWHCFVPLCGLLLCSSTTYIWLWNIKCKTHFRNWLISTTTIFLQLHSWIQWMTHVCKGSQLFKCIYSGNRIEKVLIKRCGPILLPIQCDIIKTLVLMGILYYIVCLPSSPVSLLQALLTGLWGRCWGLLLIGCLDRSLMGIRLRTSGPPKLPEPSLPWRSLSVEQKEYINWNGVLYVVHCTLESYTLSEGYLMWWTQETPKFKSYTYPSTTSWF